jgi:hypothetical protein
MAIRERSYFGWRSGTFSWPVPLPSARVSTGKRSLRLMSLDGPPSEPDNIFYAIYCVRCGRLGVVNKKFIANNIAAGHLHTTIIEEVRDLEGNPKG